MLIFLHYIFTTAYKPFSVGIWLRWICRGVVEIMPIVLRHSWKHIVQLWSCAWRLHAHVRVRASWACSWSFHEHKCSWELHEHAHEGFTSTMLECNGHNMGQDNKGPKLHFFLCEIFLANNQPILDNIFFEFSFFLHYYYQASKAKSAKRNSYVGGANFLGT